MQTTLVQAVKDMTGIKNVTESFAKQYISDHWIAFLIYQRVIFRIEDLKKSRAKKIRKSYTYKK